MKNYRGPLGSVLARRYLGGGSGHTYGLRVLPGEWVVTLDLQVYVVITHEVFERDYRLDP